MERTGKLVARRRWWLLIAALSAGFVAVGLPAVLSVTRSARMAEKLLIYYRESRDIHPDSIYTDGSHGEFLTGYDSLTGRDMRRKILYRQFNLGWLIEDAGGPKWYDNAMDQERELYITLFRSQPELVEKAVLDLYNGTMSSLANKSGISIRDSIRHELRNVLKEQITMLDDYLQMEEPHLRELLFIFSDVRRQNLMIPSFYHMSDWPDRNDGSALLRERVLRLLRIAGHTEKWQHKHLTRIRNISFLQYSDYLTLCVLGKYASGKNCKENCRKIRQVLMQVATAE